MGTQISTCPSIATADGGGYDCVGGYFVTQEQQDEVIGRVVRQYKEAEQKLATLTAEARKYADMFSAMAGILANEPQFIRIAKPDESITPGPRAFVLPDGDALNKLAKDIRDTRSNIKVLQGERQALGL